MGSNTPSVNGREPLLSVGVNVNLDGGKFGEVQKDRDRERLVSVDKRPSVVEKKAEKRPGI